MTARVALVTGASGGLGPAIVLALARDGVKVVAQYRRNERALTELAEQAAAEGLDVVPACFDVRDSEAVNDAVSAIPRAHGSLDIVVNNAGLVIDGPFALMDEESWTTLVDTNLSGTFRVSRAAARAMLAKRRGVIINVSSVAGVRASPYQANYSAAKAGILGLSRTLARELGAKGIRVNTVIPGLIDAGMGARVDRVHADAVVERTPLGRLGTADEVAAAVAFLASDAASYITGAELTVDGGLST